jgi:8-oxo-dGTP pyrophosphatase MutT (NUDIX family)
MSPPTPTAVAAALSRHAPVDLPSLPGRTNHIRAAVLIPLVWGDDIEVVLTVRSSFLRQHPGEVCFPGGTPESEEESDESTALREAREELGIEGATVFGTLSKMPVFTSDHRITPVVAQIADQPLLPNLGEVAAVLRLSIGEVLSRPSIEGLPWHTEDGLADSPVFHIGPHLMYGSTAHSFVELIEIMAPLYGTTRPPYARGDTRWSDVLPPGFSVDV